jgi:hypothetical protein
MIGQGLKFGAATSGDQAAYVALHQAMVTFSSALNSQLTAVAPRP